MLILQFIGILVCFFFKFLPIVYNLEELYSMEVSLSSRKIGEFLLNIYNEFRQWS